MKKQQKDKQETFEDTNGVTRNRKSKKEGHTI
jgi:hypothetical protein